MSRARELKRDQETGVSCLFRRRLTRTKISNAVPYRSHARSALCTTTLENSRVRTESSRSRSQSSSVVHAS
eukprot:scaffold15581_cov85-Skeletonema_dohrnii-CCMP3373.AAC.1